MDYSNLSSIAGRILGSRTRQHAGTALMCAAGACSANAQAEESLALPTPDDADVAPSVWTLAPYLWAPTFKGKVGFGGTEVHLDVTPDEIAGNVKAGGMGYVAWTKRKHFFYAEGLAANWHDHSFDEFYGQDVAGEIRFIEVGYGHHFVVDSPFGAGSQIVVSPYGGVRYASLSIKVKYTTQLLSVDTLKNPGQVIDALTSPPPPSGADDHWLDPALGVLMDVPLSGKLSFVAKLDGAGFGLSHDRYWNGIGVLRYGFSPRWSAAAGYRFAHAYAEPGAGNDLKLQLELSGPLAGVTFQL